MEIKDIKYTAPFFDGSGYAEAARQYVIALHKLGVPLTLESVSFEHARPDLGPGGVIINSLIDKKIDYNVKIVQLTCEHYPIYRETDVFNIGYSFWETDRICDAWVKYINTSIDLCFVPCQWNADAYKESGVKVPIRKIQQGIDPSEFENIKEYNIKGLSEDTYVFYSIFQWSERKHPLGLIKAYWNAFQDGEDVALVVKTYKNDFSEEQRQGIRNTIERLKDVMPMPKKTYPKMFFVFDMLSRPEILGLHKRCDCFALPQRGEGWGMPHFEAGAIGNTVLTTGMSGNMEFTNKENSYLLDYTWTPVFGMPWCPWYEGNQLWAEPDILQMIKLMEHIYNNQEEAANKGKLLQKNILENFSWKQVATKMLDTIKEI